MKSPKRSLTWRPTRRLSSRVKSLASTAEKQPRELRGVGATSRCRNRRNEGHIETQEIVFPHIGFSSLNRGLACCRKQDRGRAKPRSKPYRVRRRYVRKKSSFRSR